MRTRIARVFGRERGIIQQVQAKREFRDRPPQTMGEPIRASSIPGDWFSSTRPSGQARGQALDQDQHDPLARLGAEGRAPCRNVPHGRWKTATFLAALRNDRIEAPCLFDGPINGERFRAYVEQVLTPTLKPGDVVILDNLGSHKGKAVRRAIRDVGARLVFLPKYPPDLNPIEQVFAKFKTLPRKAGARSYEDVSQACVLDSHPISPRQIPHHIPQRRPCVNPKADRSSPQKPDLHAPRGDSLSKGRSLHVRLRGTSDRPSWI